MLIEIDLTILEKADRETLVNWQQGLITLIDISARKGDQGAVKAIQMCGRFIDEEIEKREKEGKV
jgi:hypothetical protein